jgi:gamma-glutamyltranspeptidase/glutathione hydrolase
MPVVARNVVATSQPMAVAAGIDAMRAGGNAVDAALATAITLTVVEPCSNGVGSDAFAIVGHGGDVWGLNGSGRAPSGWTQARFAGRETMPAAGWDSITVPGAVSAWVALSERFGKLPFARLFDAAIAYAADGFLVGPITAHYWQLTVARYGELSSPSEFAEFGAHFTRDGHAPRAGDLFRRPDLARTLEQIAQSRGEAFYRGELAQRIARAAAAAGGAMTQADLAAHRADWVTPIRQAYRGIELLEIPPNGQGLAAQIALAILSHFDLPALGPDDEHSIHLQIEAMKIAIRAAFEHFADARAMRVTPEELLGAASVASLAASIDAKAARLPPVRLPVSHDTAYLAAADADGMMVSMIQSNYRGFGSGVVIPGTGIAMQNRGSGFVLDPAHPNCVAPNKRPYHTIIPGFVTERGTARLSFGVMGGHMQHQGHVQMVNRIFDCGQNPQAASDAPRWHVFEDFSVGLETGFPTAVAEALAARGHAVRYETPALFGGAQLIYRLNDGYCGASDHRKEGLAAGY